MFISLPDPAEDWIRFPVYVNKALCITYLVTSDDMYDVFSLARWIGVRSTLYPRNPPQYSSLSLIRKDPRREMLIAGGGGAAGVFGPPGRRAPRAESRRGPTAYANGQGSATVGWPVIAVCCSAEPSFAFLPPAFRRVSLVLLSSLPRCTSPIRVAPSWFFRNLVFSLSPPV